MAKLVQAVYYFLFRLAGLLPRKQNLVIFESFSGKQYSCNPRAIYEYMKEHEPEYALLWSVNPRYTKLFEEHGVPYVTRFSVKWLFTMGRAKYWISNSRLPLELPKPKKTVYVQTWHGTPLKKLGVDIDEVHMPGQTTAQYKDDFVREAAKWDYLISPNAYSSKIFRSAFGYTGAMIESGYPRNDLLFSSNKEAMIAEIRQKLEIPDGKKVILYAPTWRDNDFHKVGEYKFDLKFDVAQMKVRFGEDVVLLIRMHYLVAEQFDFAQYGDFIRDVSSYDDIRDLYLVSDMLITDYSSVFFDYANLDRPMIFFTYDLAEYRDTLRGFYFDFEKNAPGPLVETSEQLMDEIATILEQPAKSNSQFFQQFCEWEDGHAAEKTVQIVFKK
ncbi:CDP-glycerol glycerophosphotransferase family protein [Listeria cornellensis]|uniref:Teichoic acid biosynthesis domain-containing protein n=1 Tax=Listeria cornellensis FSL F6-0969 TaxID=1265820 RepID=W7CAH5_9LIST|nr:CDP-glycerol glycerophosphotransferase family protein [Listeria cornellensis]EUJ32771.1 teichoic acid biosynthesis domain-containing protein [Listeria cornellensis FSL F6-0969]